MERLEHSIFQRFKPADLTKYIGPRPYAGAPEVNYDFFIFTGDHGIPGTLKPMQLDDPANHSTPDLERAVMQYVINDETHAIFTLDKVIRGSTECNDNAESNIRGGMMEHVSREIMQAFLKRYLPDGRNHGRFVGISDELKRDNYTIASDNRYELKTKTYPHAVLLEKRWSKNRTKYKFRSLTDLDGMFSYEFRDKEYTIVTESKVGNWGFTEEKKHKLIRNLITPLQKLIPNAKTEYVLFAAKGKVYAEHKLTAAQIEKLPVKIRNRIPQHRRVLRLTPDAVDIHRFLGKHGVDVTFFTFNETESQIDEATRFLIHLHQRYEQVRGEADGGRRVRGTFVDTLEKSAFYNGASVPDVEFILNPETGEYKKITHGWDILARVNGST